MTVFLFWAVTILLVWPIGMYLSRRSFRWDVLEAAYRHRGTPPGDAVGEGGAGLDGYARSTVTLRVAGTEYYLRLRLGPAGIYLRQVMGGGIGMRAILIPWPAVQLIEASPWNVSLQFAAHPYPFVFCAEAAQALQPWLAQLEPPPVAA